MSAERPTAPRSAPTTDLPDGPADPPTETGAETVIARASRAFGLVARSGWGGAAGRTRGAPPRGGPPPKRAGRAMAIALGGRRRLAWVATGALVAAWGG